MKLKGWDKAEKAFKDIEQSFDDAVCESVVRIFKKVEFQIDFRGGDRCYLSTCIMDESLPGGGVFKFIEVSKAIKDHMKNYPEWFYGDINPARLKTLKQLQKIITKIINQAQVELSSQTGGSL